MPASQSKNEMQESVPVKRELARAVHSEHAAYVPPISPSLTSVRAGAAKTEPMATARAMTKSLSFMIEASG